MKIEEFLKLSVWELREFQEGQIRTLLRIGSKDDAGRSANTVLLGTGTSPDRLSAYDAELRAGE